MAVSKRLRFEILRRDDFRCRYCGRRSFDDQAELTVDHVHPVALGGKDTPENLVAACRDCNAGKTSVGPDAPLVANVADDALRWERALEAVAWRRAQDRAAMDQIIAQFDQVWKGWTYDDDKKPIPKDLNWPDTIERFYSAGLSIEAIEHYVGVAMRTPHVLIAEKWRYFCGCCWRAIDDLQEEARRVVATGDAILADWRAADGQK